MPEPKFFSIGEVSKIKGITIKALRFYEKIGLFKPRYIDSANRYRYYSLDQFIHLDIIKASRVMGISPNDLKPVLAKEDTRELLKFLNGEKDKAVQKIDELQRIIHSITAVQSTIQNSLAAVSKPDLYFKEIPQRNIVTIEFNNQLAPEEAPLQYAKFDPIITEHRLINTYETGLLCKFDDKSVLYPARIFNTVQTDENSKVEIIDSFPAGNYLCVSYHQQNAPEQTEKVAKYLAENGLEPSWILQVDLLHDVFYRDLEYFEMQALVRAAPDD